jgi:hypothetical protein
MCRDLEKLNRRYPVCDLEIYRAIFVDLVPRWKERILECAAKELMWEKGRVNNQFSNKMFLKDEMQ